MLKANNSKVNESTEIFSESSTINSGLQNISEFGSSSLRVMRLEEENAQLKKDMLNLKLDLNKKVEVYESKLLNFKEISSINQRYQQELFDLKKRLEISTKQMIEQKNQYSDETQKINNNFENQFLELQEKIESLQKKCTKYQKLSQAKEYEKSNLDQELQIQSKKIATLLQSASNYFNYFFSTIDSFISFFSNAQNGINEIGESLKSEKKKRRSLEQKIFLLSEENSKFSTQIQNLTNQNKILIDENESLKTSQEIEFNKKKMNQIKAKFDIENTNQIIPENKMTHFNHQNQLNMIEKEEEKEDEIHNLHLIIVKLKNTLTHLKKRNQSLKQNLKLKDNELNTLRIVHSSLEEKFNELDFSLSQKTNSKVKIIKLKRKIIDLSTTIDNLRSEIIKLKCEHEEENLKNEVHVKNLQSKLNLNANSKVCSYSYSNSHCNSFNEENQNNCYNCIKNEVVLDSSYCIDESVPAEIVDSLKQIIENKGLKINLKIRLITKSLASYFNNLLNNNNSKGGTDLRKALLERAKELVLIAESQSNMNLNQEKKLNRNSTHIIENKIKSQINSNSDSIKSKSQKNINQNVSDIFSSNLNGGQQLMDNQNEVSTNSNKNAKCLNSELNTITQIDSLSQSQFNESSQKNEGEVELNNNTSLLEEEEEYFKDKNLDEIDHAKSDEEDIISGIESLVDDLELKII